MAEWQLPKLHTRVRFPSPAPIFRAFFLAALAWGSVSCAGLPQHARWTAVTPSLTNLDNAWDQTHEVISGGVRIKVMNSSQDLHLRFETDDKILQEEFSGQYGQSVLLWFAEGPRGHGLRIDFKPKADITLFTEAINTMDRTVTLLGPPGEGYPRTWTDGTEGIELSAVMDSGTLVYEVRLPLKARTLGAFALGVKPGSPLQLSIETSSLTPDSQSDLESEEEATAAASSDPYGVAPVQRHRYRGPTGGQAPSVAYATVLNVLLAQPPR